MSGPILLPRPTLELNSFHRVAGYDNRPVITHLLIYYHYNLGRREFLPVLFKVPISFASSVCITIYES